MQIEGLSVGGTVQRQPCELWIFPTDIRCKLTENGSCHTLPMIGMMREYQTDMTFSPHSKQADQFFAVKGAPHPVLPMDHLFVKLGIVDNITAERSNTLWAIIRGFIAQEGIQRQIHGDI